MTAAVDSLHQGPCHAQHVGRERFKSALWLTVSGDHTLLKERNWSGKSRNFVFKWTLLSSPLNPLRALGRWCSFDFNREVLDGVP